MASKLLVLSLLLVAVVTITAKSISKRSADVPRPETPLLSECEVTENRENCFLTDPDNLYVWETFMKDVEDWEKANPEAAAEFNKANPNVKKEEKEKLEELTKYAKIHQID